MKPLGPPASPAAFEQWVARLVEQHPEVETVGLIGSRVQNRGIEGSDWDVVLALDEQCYQAAADASELAIAFDPGLQLAGLDLFFVRPNGGLRRWHVRPEAPRPERVAPEVWEALRVGEPLGDFNPLMESLTDAEIVFSRDQGPASAGPTWPPERRKHDRAADAVRRAGLGAAPG